MDYPTGVCVCLILGDKRSLHACIGAAEHFTVDFFETDEWKTKISEFNEPDEVSLFYIEGYFIPGREDVIKYILNKYINRHVPETTVVTNVTDDTKLSSEIVENVMEEVKKDEVKSQEKKQVIETEKNQKGSEELKASDEVNENNENTEEKTNDCKESKENVKTDESVATLEPISEELKPVEEIKPEAPKVPSIPPTVTQVNHVSNKPTKDSPIPPHTPGVKNLFATNLNAAYIVKEYSETVKLLVESADLIFGNREEFEALATIYEGCQTIQDVVQLLMRKEAELDRLKIFVITDGQDPVAVYYGTDNDFRWHRYRVPPMPSEKVVDTTGAGDSFIAGFLRKFMNQGLLVDCVSNGCDIAGQVVQNIGCNLI